MNTMSINSMRFTFSSAMTMRMPPRGIVDFPGGDAMQRLQFRGGQPFRLLVVIVSKREDGDNGGAEDRYEESSSH